jgi:hypothetical protein
MFSHSIACTRRSVLPDYAVDTPVARTTRRLCGTVPRASIPHSCQNIQYQVLKYAMSIVSCGA